MRTLLNAVSLAEQMDPSLLPAIKALGFDGVRVESDAVTDPGLARDELGHVHDAGLWPLVIIHHTDQLEWICADLKDRGGAIEICNEPDRGWMPDAYGGFLMQCRAVADRNGIDCWGGAISNLTWQSLNWLRLAMPWMGPCVSFHAYADPRDADFMEFLRIVGLNRRVACSEFGFDTAPHRSSNWIKRLFGLKDRKTDTQVADLTRRMWAQLERWRCEFAAAYELNDGPNRNDPEQCFGYRTYCDEQHPAWSWKPVSTTVPR